MFGFSRRIEIISNEESESGSITDLTMTDGLSGISFSEKTSGSVSGTIVSPGSPSSEYLWISGL